MDTMPNYISPITQVHPLFILSVGDFILSILWMIGGIVWLSPGEGGWVGEDSSPHTGMCYVLAVATTVGSWIYHHSRCLSISSLRDPLASSQGFLFPAFFPRRKLGKPGNEARGPLTGSSYHTSPPPPHTQMAEMVTFLLTTVYAQSALLRIREVYLNKGRIVADVSPNHPSL